MLSLFPQLKREGLAFDRVCWLFRHDGGMWVARGEAGVLVLHKLFAACRLAQAAVNSILKATHHTSAHVARLHFLKLHLVILAQLGRMKVCTSPHPPPLPSP